MHTRLLRGAVAALATCMIAGTLAASAGAAGSATASCRGSANLCEATFSLAGGASNKRLTVQLPGTNLRLLAVNATPAYVRGAYRLFGGRFTTGGSVYTVNLDAVDSIPAGAKLFMTFGHPATGLSCGSIGGISFITIFQTGSVRPGSYSCNQARTLALAWLTRFRAHLSVRTVRAAGITFTCKLVPRLPQNLECTGGNLRVRFSGPTG
ncbi:MAG TPA: hypothetical protein VGN78_16805 [Solirubrobacteraceae bacterium]|jgi:hypothetical protein|nr:hypothetical protein [Solirubrobacteraceae bacterium]